MGSGPYDHASYLTRQQIRLGKTTAGASGTSAYAAFPASNMRIRNIAAVVVTAGTSTNNTLTVLNGTSSVGAIVLSTNAIGSIGTSGDLNITVGTNTTLSIKNGADATGVAEVVAEGYVDPASGWTGVNN